MKVECIKKVIDIEKIRWATVMFEMEHEGNKPSYVVMNYETRADLVDKNSCYFEIKGSLKNCTEIDTIFGIPVAFNKGLKYGEVDIV